jgi:hypothetical protein
MISLLLAAALAADPPTAPLGPGILSAPLFAENVDMLATRLGPSSVVVAAAGFIAPGRVRAALQDAGVQGVSVIRVSELATAEEVTARFVRRDFCTVYVRPAGADLSVIRFGACADPPIDSSHVALSPSSPAGTAREHAGAAAEVGEVAVSVHALGAMGSGTDGGGPRYGGRADLWLPWFGLGVEMGFSERNRGGCGVSWNCSSYDRSGRYVLARASLAHRMKNWRPFGALGLGTERWESSTSSSSCTLGGSLFPWPEFSFGCDRYQSPTSRGQTFVVELSGGVSLRDWSLLSLNARWDEGGVTLGAQLSFGLAVRLRCGSSAEAGTRDRLARAGCDRHARTLTARTRPSF